MNIVVEGTLAQHAEYRRTGARADGGVVIAVFEPEGSRFPIEAHVREDDAVKGRALADRLKRGCPVRLAGGSACPRIDHGTVAVIVSRIYSLRLADVEVLV